MGKGKAIAQACHASVGAALQANKKILDKWMKEGAKKVVLKCTIKELLEVEKKAKLQKLNTYLVVDAGLTQLKPGTITALAIGPDEEDKIDIITGNLKLF